VTAEKQTHYRVIEIVCSHCGERWREMTDERGELTDRQMLCPYCQLAERAR